MTPRPIPLRPDYDAANDALDEMAMSSLVRAVIAVGHQKLNPGTQTRAIAASRWGTEEANNVAAVLRAASAPAMTSTVGWAKEFSRIVLAFLTKQPLSAGADLLSRVATDVRWRRRDQHPHAERAAREFRRPGAGDPRGAGCDQHSGDPRAAQIRRDHRGVE